jgi:hypothetical protein
MSDQSVWTGTRTPWEIVIRGILEAAPGEGVVEAARRVVAERNAARDEASRLRALCIRAADEIERHFEAHADSEGFGPATLLRGLRGDGRVEYRDLRPSEREALAQAIRERYEARVSRGAAVAATVLLAEDLKRARAERDAAIAAHDATAAELGRARRKLVAVAEAWRRVVAAGRTLASAVQDCQLAGLEGVGVSPEGPNEAPPAQAPAEAAPTPENDARVGSVDAGRLGDVQSLWGVPRSESSHLAAAVEALNPGMPVEVEDGRCKDACPDGEVRCTGPVGHRCWHMGWDRGGCTVNWPTAGGGMTGECTMRVAENER